MLFLTDEKTRALIFSCVIPLIMVAYVIFVTIPGFQTSQQIPIELTEYDLETLVVDSTSNNFSQRYIVNGSDMLDTGWIWEIEHNGTKDIGFYYGILHLDTKNIFLSLRNPINTDSLSYEVQLQPLKNEDETINQVIDDMRQYPDIAAQYLPVIGIRGVEYDRGSYTILGDIGVVGLGLAFSLYYMYQFKQLSSS